MVHLFIPYELGPMPKSSSVGWSNWIQRNPAQQGCLGCMQFDSFLLLLQNYIVLRYYVYVITIYIYIYIAFISMNYC